MAVYKVPQDVEAEDKLIGPFSFRQFIYLIVVVIAGFVAWFLGQIFIGLIVIPLPFILFFGALALPLRKDQPMETYLVAVIRFFLKPRIRLWNPDGSLSMVTITVPQTTEYQLTKGFTGDEAQQRLSYLAQVIDTQGWATRGVTGAPSSVTEAVVEEAQNTEDMLDESAGVVRSFDQLISRDDARRRQKIVGDLQHPTTTTPAAQLPVDSTTTFPLSDSPIVTQSVAQTVGDEPVTDTPPLPTTIDYNPYPASMHQRVVKPASEIRAKASSAQSPEPVKAAPKEAVTPTVSPDIIRLANNNDLSISTIAREAHRLEEKDDNEVVISLR